MALEPFFKSNTGARRQLSNAFSILKENSFQPVVLRPLGSQLQGQHSLQDTV